MQISSKLVPVACIYKSTLFHVMIWCQTGDKLLPKPMMTQFKDAYPSPELNKLRILCQISVNVMSADDLVMYQGFTLSVWFICPSGMWF